jgi:hypothetical protein
MNDDANEIASMKEEMASMDEARKASDVELRAVLHRAVDAVPRSRLDEFDRYVWRFLNRLARRQENNMRFVVVVTDITFYVTHADDMADVLVNHNSLYVVQPRSIRVLNDDGTVTPDWLPPGHNYNSADPYRDADDDC